MCLSVNGHFHFIFVIMTRNGWTDGLETKIFIIEDESTFLHPRYLLEFCLFFAIVEVGGATTREALSAFFSQRTRQVGPLFSLYI